MQNSLTEIQQRIFSSPRNSIADVGLIEKFKSKMQRSTFQSVFPRKIHFNQKVLVINKHAVNTRGEYLLLES